MYLNRICGIAMRARVCVPREHFFLHLIEAKKCCHSATLPSDWSTHPSTCESTFSPKMRDCDLLAHIIIFRCFYALFSITLCHTQNMSTFLPLSCGTPNISVTHNFTLPRSRASAVAKVCARVCVVCVSLWPCRFNCSGLLNSIVLDPGGTPINAI